MPKITAKTPTTAPPPVRTTLPTTVPAVSVGGKKYGLAQLGWREDRPPTGVEGAKLRQEAERRAGKPVRTIKYHLGQMAKEKAKAEKGAIQVPTIQVEEKPPILDVAETIAAGKFKTDTPTPEQVAQVKREAAELGITPVDIRTDGVTVKAGQPLPAGTVVSRAVTPEGEIVRVASAELVPGQGAKIIDIPSKDYRRVMKRYSRMGAPSQFSALAALGIIPRGSEFIEGEKKGEWGYIPPVKVTASARFEREHIRLADGKYVPITEWNKLDERYQTIGLHQGYDKMVAKMRVDAKNFEAKHLKLADGKYVPIDQWNALPEKYQSIGIRRGYDAMVSAMRADGAVAQADYDRFTAASSVLDKAGLKDGDNYEIVGALVHEDPAVRAAIKTVFADKPEAIKQAEDFIEEHFTAEHWEAGTFPRAVSEIWRSVTPWKEEKGETIVSALQGLVKKVILEGGISVPPSKEKETFFPQKPLESAWAYKERLSRITDAAVARKKAEWEAKVEAGDTPYLKAVGWVENTFMPAVEKWSADREAEIAKAIGHTPSPTAKADYDRAMQTIWDKYPTPPYTREQMASDWYRERLSEQSAAWDKYQEESQKAMPKPVAAIGKAAIDLFTTIPATIAGVAASSVLHATAGEKQKAALAPAVLLAGMADWMAGRPKAFAADPYFEVPYTVALFRGASIKSVLDIAKKAKIKLDPGKLSTSSIAFQADIGRGALKPKMTEFAARDLIQAVEFAWGGKSKVPEALAKPKNLKQAMRAAVITAQMKMAGAPGLRDVVIKTPGGKIIGHITPFQKVATGAWHAAPDTTPFSSSLSKTGSFTTKPGIHGGYWMSPQPASSFMASGKLGKPGLIFHRFSVKDLRELPPEVLKLPTFAQMKATMGRLARTGQLKPGIYPVFKWYSREMKYELEFFVAPGTRFGSVKATRYAPKREYGTASMQTTSLIQFRETATRTITDPKTGKTRTEPILDPITGRPTFTGREIKEGQSVPVLVVATTNAAKEGMAKVPPLSQLYKSEFFYDPLITIRKILAGREKRRKVEPSDYDIPSVSTSTIYKYKPFEFKPPKKAASDMATADFFRVEGEIRVLTPEIVKAFEARYGTGGRVDAAGYIMKAREPYKHPDPAKKGTVKSRVTVIIRDPKTGEVLMAKHKVEPAGTINLPGGQIDPTGKVRVRKYGDRISPVEVAREQVLSELGIDIKNIKFVGFYRSKATEYAMPGSYVFIAEPVSRRVKVSDPQEIIGYTWFKSRDKATMSFVSKDILSAFKDIDVSKVNTYGQNAKYWGKWKDAPRDVNFPKRVQTNALQGYKLAILSELAMPKKLTPAKSARLIAEAEKLGTWERLMLDNRAKIERRAKALAEQEILKGKDPQVAFQNALVKAMDEFDKKYFDSLKDLPKLRAERIRMRELEAKYEQLPYRPSSRRGVVIKREEPAVEPATEMAAMRLPEKEYIPESMLEYDLLYPKVEPRPEVVLAELPPEPIPRPKIEPTPEPTMIEPRVEPAPEPVPEPRPEPEPIPEPTPIPEPRPEPEPIPEPTPIPEPAPVPRISEPPLTTIIKLKAEVVGKEAHIPQGSIAWRQGAFWKYIPPPYDQPKPITLARGITPMGAVKTDLRTTKETIQKIGESDAVVPEKIAADLGISDLFISNQAQDIHFTGKGLGTNVGKRIPTTTQGMSVKSGVARSAMPEEVLAKKTPSRKVLSKPRPKAVDRGDGFLDEDEDWLRSLDPPVLRKRATNINRSRVNKQSTRQGRSTLPTVMGGIR